MTAPKASSDPGREWLLRSLIARHRYVSGVEREVLQVLRDTHRRIAKRILETGLSRNENARLRGLYAEISQMLKVDFRNAEGRAVARFRDLAKVEQQTADLAVGLSSALPRSMVVEMATMTQTVRDLPVHGGTFGEAWAEGAAKALERIKREVQYGMALGENPLAIARRIFMERDTKGQTAGAAWKGTRTGLRMLLRTVSTTLQAQSALASMRQAGIARCRFEAILDDRTSVICASYDGTEWAVDDPALPIPALHPNCRSTLVPIVTLTKRDGSVVTATSSRKDYETWLREQPPEVQDRVLGKGRAALWRKGRVSLAEMVTTDNRPITLKELQRDLNPRRYASSMNDPNVPRLTPLTDGQPVDATAFAAVQRATWTADEIAPLFRQLVPEGYAEAADALDLRVAKAKDAVVRFNKQYNDPNFDWSRLSRADLMALQQQEQAMLVELDRAERAYDATVNTTARDAARAILARPDNAVTDPALFPVVATPTDRAAMSPLTRMGANPLKDADLPKVENGLTFLRRVLDYRGPAVGEVQIVRGAEGRALYNANTKTVYLNAFEEDLIAQMVVHELGHALEVADPQLMAAAQQWRDANSTAKLQDLASLTGLAHHVGEQVRPPKGAAFYSPYIGRVYADGGTEVIAMGLELLYRDPIRLALRYPSHFNLLMRLFR